MVRTGIHARTMLNLPQYDRLFTLRAGPAGECICEMKRDGSIRCDVPDYWEVVPAPEGWTGEEQARTNRFNTGNS